MKYAKLDVSQKALGVYNTLCTNLGRQPNMQELYMSLEWDAANATANARKALKLEDKDPLAHVWGSKDGVLCHVFIPG